jgi:hypothetical protein
MPPLGHLQLGVHSWDVAMNDGEHNDAVYSTISSAMSETTRATMATTAVEIRRAMEALVLGPAYDYFHRDLDDDDMEPILVCSGVSVDAFNEYVGDGEDLPIGVRFLQLEGDGRLLMVDSATWIHEATKCQFDRVFRRAAGNEDEINGGGSVTMHRGSEYPVKEADATFGPFARTPNRSPKPPNVTRWITLPVEIGHWQTWASLRVAALWWHGLPGIKYVLLLKIGSHAQSLAYELYDVNCHPMEPRGGLPPPVATGRIDANPNGPPAPGNVVLEAHQLLAIPQGLPLPVGVNDCIIVDLRDVMRMVIRSLE